MRKKLKHHSGISVKFATLMAVMGLLFSFGCSQKKADGYFLIVDLENTENIKQYSVFNPYTHSQEECEATAKTAIAEILASNAVPKDSKVTGWRCSLNPPDRGG